MKKLLTVTAIIEGATGIALLAAPAVLVSILLGGTLDAPAGLVLARLAGVALISISIACWSGSQDIKSRAVIGIVAAMLFYNIAAASLLLGCRVCAGMTGIGLLPASALHAGLAVWCVVCLRSALKENR